MRVILWRTAALPVAGGLGVAALRLASRLESAMSNVEQRRSRRTPDGTGAHLELTATDHGAPPTPHVEDLLVLYLSSRDEVDRLVAQAGAQRIPSANPYWDRPESPSWIPTDSG